jgi:hypothetical protein
MAVFFKRAAVAAAMLAMSAAASAGVSLTITYDHDNNGGTAVKTLTCTGSGFGICFGDTAGVTSSFGSASGDALGLQASNWFGWNFGGTAFNEISSASGNFPGADTARLSLSNFSIARRTTDTGSGVLNFNVIGLGYDFPAAQDKTYIGSSTMSRFEGPNIQASSNMFTKFYANQDDLPPGGPLFPLGDERASCTGLIGSNPNDRSCSVAGSWSDAGAPGFSLRIQQQITLAKGESVQTQASMTTTAAVPEPMTLSLVGAALLSAAALSRRQSKKA